MGALWSGVLLGCCFPPLDWWPLAWIALVPLGFVVCRPRMTRQIWAGVYLGGLLFHLVGLDWMRTAYGATSWQGPSVTGWLLYGQCGALLFALVLVAARVFYQRMALRLCWTLPVVWVTFELAHRGLLIFIDQTGGPWLSLGLTQVPCAHISQLADLGGEHLITLVVAAANGLFCDIFFRLRGHVWTPWEKVQVGGIPVCLVLALGYGSWRLGQSPGPAGPTICLMGKRDLPPLLMAERIDAAAGTPLSDRRKPELLVWPEQAFHHKLVDLNRRSPATSVQLPADLESLSQGDVVDYSHRIVDYLEHSARELDVAMLVGCERLECDGRRFLRFNSLAFVDPAHGYRGCYDKCHLVPWTEFAPYDRPWLKIEHGETYRHGKQAGWFEIDDGAKKRCYRFGVAICYDVAFANYFRRLMRGPALDFFIQCGSERHDATGTLSTILLRMAQLRAIECRRAIVRNAHCGHSALIDGNGQILWKSNQAPITRPINVGAVPIDGRFSLYRSLGDWWALGIVLFLGVGAIRLRTRR